MANFLTGRAIDGSTIWACIDDSLCTSPAVAERRFAAYMTPFADEQEARQALLEAGAKADTIAAELRSARQRARR